MEPVISTVDLQAGGPCSIRSAQSETVRTLQGGGSLLGSPYNKATSTQMTPALGPKVRESDLLSAMWSRLQAGSRSAPLYGSPHILKVQRTQLEPSPRATAYTLACSTILCCAALCYYIVLYYTALFCPIPKYYPFCSALLY